MNVSKKAEMKNLIEEMMNNWDEAIRLAIASGMTKEDSIKAAGDFFSLVTRLEVSVRN